MAIVFVGIDLAKNVFALHGVNEHGRAALVRPSVARAKLHELVASLPPCTIGMEACTGAHHWARLFIAAGHTVRLIAPKFVVPYRLSGVNGAFAFPNSGEVNFPTLFCSVVSRRSTREPPFAVDPGGA